MWLSSAAFGTGTLLNSFLHTNYTQIIIGNNYRKQSQRWFIEPALLMYRICVYLLCLSWVYIFIAFWHLFISCIWIWCRPETTLSWAWIKAGYFLFCFFFLGKFPKIMTQWKRLITKNHFFFFKFCRPTATEHHTDHDRPSHFRGTIYQSEEAFPKKKKRKKKRSVAFWIIHAHQRPSLIGHSWINQRLGQAPCCTSS